MDLTFFIQLDHLDVELELEIQWADWACFSGKDFVVADWGTGGHRELFQR